MTDQQLQQLLPDYIAGRLEAELCKEIEAHLAESETLRTALEEAQQYTDAIDALEPHEAPEGFLDQVHEGIEKQQGLASWLFRPFHIKIPLELAGVAVTVVLLILLFNPFLGRVPTDMLEPERATYRAEKNREFAQQPEPATDAVTLIPADTAATVQEEPREKERTIASAKKSVARRPTAARRAAPRRRAAQKPQIPALQAPVELTTDAISEEAPAQRPKIQKTERKDAVTPPRKSPPAPVTRAPQSAPTATIPAPQPAMKKEAVSAGYSNQATTASPPPPARAKSAPAPAATPFESDEEDAFSDADVSADKSVIRSVKKSKPVEKKRMAESEAAVTGPPLEDLQMTARQYNAIIDTIIFSDTRNCKAFVLVPEKSIASFKKTLSKRVNLIGFKRDSAPATDDRIRIALQVSKR